MTMTAPETVTINAKNIFLNGKEIELNGDNIKLNASQKILEQSPTIGLDANGASGQLTLKATKKAELNGGKETNIAGNEIISSSTANTTINGMIVKINS